MPTNPNANKNQNPPRQPQQNQQDDNNRKPASQQQAGGGRTSDSPPNKPGTQNPSRSSWDEESGNSRSASGNRVNDDSADNGKSRR